VNAGRKDDLREQIAAVAVEGAGAENAVTSCDLHVLVYETAEPVSSQRPEPAQERVGSGASGRRGPGAAPAVAAPRPRCSRRPRVRVV